MLLASASCTVPQTTSETTLQTYDCSKICLDDQGIVLQQFHTVVQAGSSASARTLADTSGSCPVGATREQIVCQQRK